MYDPNRSVVLRTLRQHIRGVHRFTEEKYPALKGAGQRQRYIFEIGHIIHHISKITGKISSQLEAADHGLATDGVLFQNCAAELLICALQLFDTLSCPDAAVTKHVLRSLGKRP